MREKSRAAVLALVVACAVLAGTTPAQAAAVKQRNVVDLISLSEIIAVGKVLHVEDGIDAKNVPYTQITLDVMDSIKGIESGQYSFRQYGLLAPREMDNGLMNLNVRLQGWPSFAPGEEVMVFLYKAAEQTGLRTTVGLFQGKFSIRDEKISNAIENANVFKSVKIENSTLNPNEAKLLRNEKGAMPAQDFISFVRRAVREGWIEKGRMTHELH